MTTEEIIKQGLEHSNEPDFRRWAAQWFPEIYHRRPTFKWESSLGEWAFRAREEAGDDWRRASYEVWKAVQNGVAYSESYYLDWMASKGTVRHWIIAGCIAKELSSSESSKVGQS